MLNTNAWNRLRYTLWAPGYDLIASPFARSRQRSIELAELKPGQRVLIVGCGTGLDLEGLPPDIECSAVDITPAMIHRTRRRAARLSRVVDAQVMDAQQLRFPDSSFDVVFLHLIVAVVPDPVACVLEAQRVLRPGGRILVFDKFADDDRPVPCWRRLVNPLASFLATDVTRKLGDILSASHLRIVHTEGARFGTLFKIFVLQPPSGESASRQNAG